MSQMSEIIGLLAQTDRQFERAKHRLRRARIILYLILTPLYVTSLGFTVSMLIRIWQGNDSLQFWVSFASTLPFATSSAQLIWSFASDSRAPLYPPITALRESIRTGDATLAPIATDDAAPALDPSPTATNRIGPLHRPMKWSHPLIVLASTLLVVAIIAVPILLVYVSIQAGMLLSVTLLLLATTSYVLAYRAVGPVRVRVDADGLRWPRLLGGYHRLLWRDAQALIQSGDVRLFLDDRKMTFIVYSAERVFTWNITDSSRQQRERAATQSLLRAISQHTSLPLRDVSTEARRLAYELIDPLTIHKVTPQEHKYRLRVTGVVVLPFIIIALLAGLLPLAQPLYFEHAYAQSHASAPLYADPLTNKDGAWPETGEARFTGTSYTITHDIDLFGFHPTLILAPHRYDNALYEVTTRASSDTTAGLAILGDARSQPIVAFTVTSEGAWSLRLIPLATHHDITESTIRDGNSMAIPRGPGTPNCIGMLVQGSDVTFYINGHYIAHYHDDHLAGGYPGLYLDSEPGRGSFINFAIYPA